MVYVPNRLVLSAFPCHQIENSRICQDVWVLICWVSLSLDNNNLTYVIHLSVLYNSKNTAPISCIPITSDCDVKKNWFWDKRDITLAAFPQCTMLPTTMHTRITFLNEKNLFTQLIKKLILLTCRMSITWICFICKAFLLSLVYERCKQVKD